MHQFIDEIKEGIAFDGKHSKEFGLLLRERNAPTPAEKTIQESLPFVNGVYDFSMILGERFYENRPLTYVFELYNRDYEKRKTFETVVKNWLMKPSYMPLYDDHARNYYYMAKCQNVDVADNHSARRLEVTAVFDAYPFKKSSLPEGHDLWNEFNFELDVAQPTSYTVNGSLTINLINAGSCSVEPTVTASEQMTIEKEGVTYTVPKGESKSSNFRLKIGDNPMRISGNGTIKFDFYKELI